MSFLSIPNVKIKGIAACVPKRKEYNKQYLYLSPEELDKYITTIGVEERRCAVHDGSLCTSDLCFESANRLLDALSCDRTEIGVIVFVSHTADYKLPSTACILQERLGITKQCMAFDVPLGCSGFVYGLGIISSILQSGFIKKGLLLVGNTQSVYAYPKDQGTSLLFADAGSAMILEYDTNADSPFLFNFLTDGSGKDALIVPDGGCRNPFTIDSLKEYTDESGVVRTKLHEKMDGLEVFKFATGQVPKSINELIEKFNINKDSIDYLLLHQANKFLCEKIRKKLKFTEEQTPYNIDRFGNTSGTTIPLLLVTELRKQLESEKLNFIASGFGVGLSLGSVMFNTNKIIVPDLIEI